MTLTEYISQLQARIGGSRGAIQELHYAARVSRPTIYKALSGAPVTLATAQKLSAATEGAVSVNALVNPSEVAA